MELLFAFEGGRLNGCSGSGLKEMLIMDQRRDILEEVSSPLYIAEQKKCAGVTNILWVRVDDDPTAHMVERSGLIPGYTARRLCCILCILCPS